MGKREARRLAMSRTWSGAELLNMIQRARESGRLDEPSKVNRALSRGRALEILKNAVDESLDYVPIDRFGDKRSLAILLITNVLREAA